MKKSKLTRFDYFLLLIILLMAAPLMIAAWKSAYSQLTSGVIADADAFLVLDVTASMQKYYEWQTLKADLASFDTLEIPNDTDPTVDAQGEIAWDSSDEQLIVYGTAARVFTYKNRHCFTLENPADADDDIPVFSLDDGFTITRLDCIVDGGTSAVVVLNDGTNNLDSMTCATTETSDASMSGNNTFTALEGVEADVGTVTGSVDWVRFCFSYTITRE